jgi:hypothetical protein
MRSTLRLQHAPTTFILRQRRLLAAMTVSITTLANAQAPPQVAVVSGTVTDVTGATVTRATVQLLHPGDGPQQTTTDSSGHFEIKAGPGEYLLVTAAAEFLTDKLSLRLSATSQSTEHIALAVENIRTDQMFFREPPIETLDASLTATLPLTPFPPLKLHFRASKNLRQ